MMGRNKGGGGMLAVLRLLAVLILGVIWLLPSLICCAVGGPVAAVGVLSLLLWAVPACWVLDAWLTWRRGEQEDYV
ncbi:MAG: hypothetical protein IJE29_01850 [Firmicutes bacterium]|nr:hypothetical protein [Bacillota bacterium]